MDSLNPRNSNSYKTETTVSLGQKPKISNFKVQNGRLYYKSEYLIEKIKDITVAELKNPYDIFHRVSVVSQILKFIEIWATDVQLYHKSSRW